jgi:hypothetical protein
MCNSLDGHAMVRHWEVRERISSRKKKRQRRSEELVNSKSKKISPQIAKIGRNMGYDVA